MEISSADENRAVGAAARVHLEQIGLLMSQGRVLEARDTARDVETLLGGVRRSDRVLDGLLDELRTMVPTEPLSPAPRQAPAPTWTRLVILAAILIFVYGVSVWPAMRERQAMKSLHAAANQCLTIEEAFVRRVREGIAAPEFVSVVRAQIEPSYEALRLVWVESRAGYGKPGPSSVSEAGRAMASWKFVADQVSKRATADLVIKMSDTPIPFDLNAPASRMDEGDRQGLEAAEEAVRAGRAAWDAGN